MRTVILGAGFSGLTAAYQLLKQGNEVIILEKSGQTGGAGGGFKLPGWDWYLDYAYHHSFTNERLILKLSKEIGFGRFFRKRPETGSLYLDLNRPEQNFNPLFQYLFGQKTRIYKLDSATDLLKFDRLPFIDRLRTGLVLAILKFGPELALYNRISAKQALSLTMGKAAYQELWQPLFEKKFSRYHSQINLGFFWARLRRSSTLLYPPGGYQTFANQLTKVISQKGGKIYLNNEVRAIKPNKKGFTISTGKQTLQTDRLINTLQSPLFLKLEKGLLPQSYRQRLEKIQYLGSYNVILASQEKVMPSTYWLSLAAKSNRNYRYPGLDWMVLVQQSNFIPAKYYGNQHLLYLATYTNNPKPFVIRDKKLANKYQILKELYLPYGQPLFDLKFTKNKPDYLTPIRNLYFANMELTYPFDRGVNQAINCGQTVVKKMIK